MVRSQKSFDTDAIASCLLTTLESVRYAADCAELLSLMLEILENPDIGTQPRLRVLTEQCQAMWFSVQDGATVGLERLDRLCNRPVTDTKPKSTAGSTEPES